MTYDDIKNDKLVCMVTGAECKCQHGKHVLEDGRIKKDSSDNGILMCLWQLVMMFFFRWKSGRQLIMLFLWHINLVVVVSSA